MRAFNLLLLPALLLTSCMEKNSESYNRNSKFERQDFKCEIGMNCKYEGLYEIHLQPRNPEITDMKVLFLTDNNRDCVPFLLSEELYVKIEREKIIYSDENAGVKISGTAIKRDLSNNESFENYNGRRIKNGVCSDKPYIIQTESFEVFILSMP